MSEFLMVKRDLVGRMIDCAESYVDIDDADLIELRAVLAQEAGRNQCGNCGAETVQACNDKGCHFFESGNGEPTRKAGWPKPVAWLYKNTNIGNELSLLKLDHFYRPYTPAGEHDYVQGIPLYAEPPPQHPILKVLSDPQTMELVALKATVAQQAQLIESLKKGSGEAVAWIKPDVAKTLRKDECCYAFGEQNQKETLMPLYASPPAPVAVVLPERKPITPGFLDATNRGWNAYDDEFKRLNPRVLGKVKELDQ